MGEVRFPFERRSSPMFGEVHRPVALFEAQAKNGGAWMTIHAIVDTGADYTLLRRAYARLLGVNLESDCTPHTTVGIGGQETVYLLDPLRIRIGPWEHEIPVGFLDRDTVPALLGRQRCIEELSVTLERHETIFRW